MQRKTETGCGSSSTKYRRQIMNRIRKLQELEAQKVTLENQITAVKGQIQAKMQATEEIKAAYPYICQEYTKPTESRRFTVAEAK